MKQLSKIIFNSNILKIVRIKFHFDILHWNSLKIRVFGVMHNRSECIKTRVYKNYTLLILSIYIELKKP